MYDDHLQRLKSSRSPLAQLAGRLVEICWQKAPPQLRCLHDVGAVAYAVDRSLVTTRRLKVQIVTEGSILQGFTLVTTCGDAGPTTVGIGLDGDRLRPSYFDRVCGSPTAAPP